MDNVTIAQEKAHKRYEAKCKHFMLRLRLDKDEDVLNWLACQPSANEAIKKLIREDIIKGF